MENITIEMEKIIFKMEKDYIWNRKGYNWLEHAILSFLYENKSINGIIIIDKWNSLWSYHKILC